MLVTDFHQAAKALISGCLNPPRLFVRYACLYARVHILWTLSENMPRLFCFLLICGLCGLVSAGCQDSTTEPSADSKPIWYEPPQDDLQEMPLLDEIRKQDDVMTNNMTGVDSLPTRSVHPTAETPLPTDNTPQKTAADSAKYGIGVSLDGFRPFPNDDPWNQNISQAEVDPQSDQILAYIGLGGNLHPDFGSGTWNGSKIGIPYIVVPGDQPRVTIRYEAYGDESDPGPYPLPFNTPVEGDPHDAGDRHAIVIDRDHKILYELYRAFPINGGASWRADSGAIFDLQTNTQRPRGWTSADAAGLPIFPGLVRYDEVGEQKEIRHALRFTLDETRRAFVPPASHWASSNEHPLLPPLGMRVRLKKEVPLDDYPESARVILQALKTYGMILADNGSDWFVSGCPDERWNNDELQTLKRIKVKDLEILKMDGLVTPYSF